METQALLETMKEYAIMHHIPIIEEESIIWLGDFLNEKKITNILEIGGAIGYSTICLQHLTRARVLSVERDEQRYEQGQIFLQDFSDKAAITVVNDDAKTEAVFELAQKQAPYDLLFIDATKRHNQYFFEMFASLIRVGGYIVTDNLHFRGLVSADAQTIAQLPRRVRPMVRAVIDYRAWLSEHDQFSTEFIAIGDGLAISQKIK